MVTTAIFFIVYYILYFITFPLTLLADVVANVNVTSAITLVKSYVSVWSGVVPLDTVMAIGLISLGIFIGVSTYRLIMLGKSFIPWISG